MYEAHARAQTGEDKTQVDQLKQIRESDPSFLPQLVIVSVGGNDAGFGTLGEICLAPGNCDSQHELFERNLPTVPTALVATYASIRAALPGVPIAVVPYVQPLADRTSCGDLPFSERAFIRRFVAELDETVKSAAQEEHLYYMDTMASALADAHLQLCDPANHGHSGINVVNLTSVNGLVAQRFSPLKWIHNSLHPNERGHKALLVAFESWLDSHPTLTPPDTSAVEAPPASVPVRAPPCSMTSTDSSSCQVTARQWETKQALALWPWAFGLVAALTGLWLLSVGLLSRLRVSTHQDAQRSSGI